jgi:hypothetical protein
MTGVLPHPDDAQTLRSLYTAVQQAGQTLADCTRAQDAAGANQAHHTLNTCSAAFMDKLHSLGH